MTRDNAIRAATARTGGADPANFIDLCVELGMLKLDEPKTFTEKLFGVAGDNRIVAGGARERALNLPDLFNEYGLKIVEK